MAQKELSKAGCRTVIYREYHSKQMQRLRRTEGTYAYKESHRLGLPGIQKYIYNRTKDLLQQRKALEEQLNGKR